MSSHKGGKKITVKKIIIVGIEITERSRVNDAKTTRLDWLGIPKFGSDPFRENPVEIAAGGRAAHRCRQFLLSIVQVKGAIFPFFQIGGRNKEINKKKVSVGEDEKRLDAIVMGFNLLEERSRFIDLARG